MTEPGTMGRDPTPAAAVRQEQLTYAPLDWNTHPIDTVRDQQGWGPFHGPYTPFNFPDPATSMAGAGIDDTWFQGDNRSAVSYSPPYDILTLQTDNSTQWVNNALAQINGDSSGASTRLFTSTFSNASPDEGVNGKRPPNTFVGRVKSMLGME